MRVHAQSLRSDGGRVGIVSIESAGAQARKACRTGIETLS